MAAVVKGSSWCKLLLALVLIISITSSAGLVDTSPITRMTFLELSGKEGIITAHLSYSTIEIDIEYDPDVLAQAMHEGRKGDQQASQEILESAGLSGYMDVLEVESEPLADAELNFFYIVQELDANNELVYTRIEIDGCNPIFTGEEGTDEEGIAHCPIPEEVYEDRCVEVFVSYGDPVYGAQQEGEHYQFAQESMQVCDKETEALGIMSTALKRIFAGNMDSPFCFISILMGGLLLASMFFAGRSPLMLLDITTPLLPKAKTISYSGLTMGTGFSRITKEMATKAGNIQSSSRETQNELIRRLRSMRGYNKGLIDRILNSKGSEVFKMMALRALLAGKDKRFINRILGLDALFKKGGVNGEAYQKEYGAILSDLMKLHDSASLNLKNKLHDRVILISQMNAYNQMQMASFGAATGDVPSWLKSGLGKTFGRLPFLGTHVMGGTASLFFGGRQVGRFYSTAARGIVRKVGDATTPEGEKKYTKRVQEAVDSARRAGRKPGFFQKWIALSDREKNLVKIFDNFEYGEGLYERLMHEAKKDVLNWLVGNIIKQCKGKPDLSEEEVLKIGLEGRDKNGKLLWEGTPEDLMFKGFKHEKFKKIEQELRKILSNTKADDLAKAEQIISLMKRHRFSFDESGVTSAINRLRYIDSEIPAHLLLDSEGYINKDAIIAAHKLERLQSYLKEQFKIDQPINLKADADKGKFFFRVGRQDPARDFTFGTFFHNTYRKSLETPTKDPLSITDIANYAFLRVVNERWGIIDPNTPGLRAELKIVMRNAERWMQSLANFSAFGGAKSRSEIPMNALIASLYSADIRPGEGDLMAVGEHGKEYGAKAGKWRMDMHAHWKTIGGTMGGAKASVENQAHGEVNLAHTVPLAIQRLMDANPKLSMNEASEHYLKKSVIPSYLFRRLQGIIEQDNPNTYSTFAGEFHRFKEQWGAYKARIFEHPELIGLKKGEISGVGDVTDKQVEQFIHSTLSLKDISKSSWIRLKEGSFVPFVQGNTFKVAQADRVVNAKTYIRRGGHWEEFAPEKFSKEAPFKELLGKEGKLKKWLFGETDYILREGEIRGISGSLLKKYVGLMDKFDQAERKKVKTLISRQEVDSLLADLDRLAAKSPKNAEACAAMAARLLSNYGYDILAINADPSKLNLDRFGSRLANKIRMELLIKAYSSAETKEQRTAAATALKNWASQGPPGEERQVKVALLFYNRGMGKEDWADFNGYSQAIKVAPGSIHIPGKPSDAEAYEQVGGVRGWLKRGFDNVREFTDPCLKSMNVGLEQFMLSTFGKQMNAEYTATMTSEYFRETGAKFAAKLAAGEFGNIDDRNNVAMREYNRLMDSFHRYHAVWDETITRDPRGNSSAIGTAFIYSAFFHHGPAMAFGPGPYSRWRSAGYNQPWSTWGGFKANVRERLLGLQAAPLMFNWAVGTPFGVAYRTYITSRWGFMTKYDRQYNRKPIEKTYDEYQNLMKSYEVQVEKRKDDLVLNGISRANAVAQATREFKDTKPMPPSFELERDTLHPYAQTEPRKGEAHAALLNWFYASFDPTATNPKRFFAAMAAAPILPLAQFIPSRWLQSAILKNGTAIMNREDKNPYYVTPGGLRGQLIKHTGPMVKRQYGGTELVTGVVRSHEDTWAYQAGVNAIWGNANPGVSYIDFSRSLQMDPRAANYLRYESRFRPFFQYDDYIKRQANLGLVKRDIDPFKMMMERNSELRHYTFPQNTLFRFLSPATLAGYKGKAYLDKIGKGVSNVRDFFKGSSTDNYATRGTRVAIGAQHLYSSGEAAIGNYIHKKGLGFRKALRHCQSCGGPMAEGGTCRACSQKARCSHCGQLVNPSQNHTCTHGLSRSIMRDALSGDESQRRAMERRNKWGREV